jgi:Superfamily II DNA and RNA helicases
MLTKMSSGDHSHLENLKKLQFLVVDEADRMISQGSFPQLERIFEKIQRANPSLEYLADHMEEEEDDDDSDSDGGVRLRSLPGIRGEAKVQMLNDNILEMIERQKSEINEMSGDDSNDEPSFSYQDVEEQGDSMEVDQEKCEAEADNCNCADDESDDNEQEDVPVKRQTFVFSATLTLPSSSLKVKRSRENLSKNRKKGKHAVDGALADIMEKIGAQGIAKIVDLSTSEPSTNGAYSSIQRANSNLRLVNLPAGLSLFEIRCTQKHKDSHLYSFLTTTKQGSSGPCLVFCNSISGVKRVYETLKVLKVPVRMLHSQMQQKARLSSLESLTGSNSCSVVIATDVAARGLDIPSVSTVVHYDVARAVDTFVHRAGRTARGVGETAVGWSVSLVSASEEKAHQTICRAVRGDGTNSFVTAPIDGRLLANAQERVNLASKIVACENVESRTKKNNQWFIEAAKDADIELDSELLEDGQLGGSNKDRQQYLDAKRARLELNVLLSKPMRKQMFEKFLSNVGEAENHVIPHGAPNAVDNTRRSKKKRKK